MKTKTEIEEIIENNDANTACSILGIESHETCDTISEDDIVFIDLVEDRDGNEYDIIYEMRDDYRAVYLALKELADDDNDIALEMLGEFFRYPAEAIYNFWIDDAKLVLKSYNDLHR